MDTPKKLVHEILELDNNNDPQWLKWIQEQQQKLNDKRDIDLMKQVEIQNRLSNTNASNIDEINLENLYE